MRDFLTVVAVWVSLAITYASPVEAQLVMMPSQSIMKEGPTACDRDRSASTAGTTIYWNAHKIDFAIAQKHGISLRRSADSIDYIANLPGQPVVVRSGKAFEETEESISEELSQLTVSKIQSLENRFGITVSREQSIRYSPKRPNDSEPESLMQVRQPSLGEVLAVEYALERSLPETNGKFQLQILFPKTISTLGALAKWEISSRNKATIIVEPTGGIREQSLEYVLLHELSHHSQYKMGYDPLSPYGWRFCNQLGWHCFKNPLTGESDWTLETQSSSLYKYSTPLHCWVSCNRAGQPVDETGARVKHQYEANHLTSKQILEMAKVRPCTSYIDNPLEVLAEGLAMYRIDRLHRARLMERTPELYNIVKDFDQQVILRQFGAGLMRSVEGQVVATSTHDTSGVIAFEQQILASASIGSQ